MKEDDESKQESEVGFKERLFSPERFEVVLSSISDGLFAVDDEWRIGCFNRAAEKITGYSRDAVMGMPCRDVFRANICDGACALRYTTQTGEPIVDLAITIETEAGEELPVSISTAVLKDKTGRVVGGVETFRDLRVVESLRKEIEKSYSFHDIIGKSARMQQLFAILPTIAAGGSTVLIEGESGTGKELFARAVHRLSPRAEGPFVPVNCGALPANLIESELFGYKAGAFTGARADKPGRVEMAEGGTLFLDEIGDLPSDLQVKLLRFLQEKTYEPLGDVRTRRSDAAIVAATNRDLEKLVESGAFRSDLFYRLNVIRLRIPPLRERMEDVELLVDHFLARLSMLRGKRVHGVTPQAMRPLLSHHYPGNVRELENIVEHAFVLSPGGLIQPEHLPDWLAPDVSRDDDLPTSLEDLEKRYIVKILERNQWNRLAAAEEMGIHKTTLHRKIKQLGIQLPKRDGRSARRDR